MRKIFFSVFLLLLALGSIFYILQPSERKTSPIIQGEGKIEINNQEKVVLAKNKITTAPGTIKPIENLLRKTSLLCSDHLPTPFGPMSNYNAENLNLSTTAESGNCPLHNLSITLTTTHSTEPEAFDDHWVNINSAKGLHNAASKDGKLDYVLKMSQKMHLPPSLAIVPIVESNYKTKMVSSAGAAGVWQLMPETAKDYGINRRERFQLAASTKAALNLLKDLHAKFHNWELAFAAYNAGDSRVAHAIRKNPGAQSIEELDLPRETKNYVFRIRKINAFILQFAHMKKNISQMITDFEY